MMSNQFNVIKFYETFARIISEREKVEIAVHVRLKEEGKVIDIRDLRAARGSSNIDRVSCR